MLEAEKDEERTRGRKIPTRSKDENAVHIVHLKFSETRKFRKQLLEGKWLTVDEELPENKIIS